MKASKMLIPTLKEAPNEAQIDSHILLLRAGMIKKLVAGVYNYLPMGLRVLKKIEDIVREEMDQSGALEILSSAVQPKELWEESGRWYKYGPELMRFKDRHDREFCLGPTHEEIFTDLAREIIKSPKQLPMNIYQIQTKYRDELRPRFGLMRGREFIMKDAYSFDLDEAGLETSYQLMYDTYSKIFTRFSLNFKPVLADTGAIGGNGSHQFMALSDIGESNIVYCNHCGLAADEEKMEAIPSNKQDEQEMLEITYVDTPKAKTIEEVSSFLNIDPKNIVKSLLYKDTENNRIVMVLVRADHDVNEIKVVNELNIAEAFLQMANDDDFKEAGCVAGYMGPIGANCLVLVDREVALMKNFVVGANKFNTHILNANFNRDFTGTVCDVRNACSGDICPVCGEKMEICRGIEVGQIFKLQTKYSQSMKCTYQSQSGENVPMVMGCYGIGITRTMSSIIEQHHDEFGIKWPLNVAPYHCVVVPVNYNDETQKNLATEIYSNLLKNKVEVILDDRDAKPGFKFKDWELIGIPYIIIVGRNAINNIVEFKVREDNIKNEMNANDAMNVVLEAVKSL